MCEGVQPMCSHAALLDGQRVLLRSGRVRARRIGVFCARAHAPHRQRGDKDRAAADPCGRRGGRAGNGRREQSLGAPATARREPLAAFLSHSRMQLVGADGCVSIILGLLDEAARQAADPDLVVAAMVRARTRAPASWPTRVARTRGCVCPARRTPRIARRSLTRWRGASPPSSGTCPSTTTPSARPSWASRAVRASARQARSRRQPGGPQLRARARASDPVPAPLRRLRRRHRRDGLHRADGLRGRQLHSLGRLGPHARRRFVSAPRHAARPA